MDDDDFNSELLGGLQRQRNLQQNEATRQSIEGLRADLKKKEAAEAAAPKCPYCAGTISNGVVKCRHCASDIAWYKVEAKQYPMKTGEDPQPYIEKKLQELERERRAQKAEREAAENRAEEQNAWFKRQRKKEVKNNIRFFKCLCLSFVFCILAGIGMALCFDFDTPFVAVVSVVTMVGTIPAAGLFYLISEFRTPPAEQDPPPVEQDSDSGSTVSVTVDSLTQPSAIISGKVTFSDGECATWLVDRMGQLRLDPETENYRPSAEDIATFQEELQKAASKEGI